MSTSVDAVRIKRVAAVWFSPTGGTRRACMTLARALAAKAELAVETVDITPPEMRKKHYEFRADELVVFGVPTYAGRVPNLIAPDIRRAFAGNGAWALPLVSFGGRGFDDAAGELASILKERGFCIAGGAAIAAPHAFSENIAPRPADADEARISDFAEQVWDRLAAGAASDAQIPCPGGMRSYYMPLGTDGKPAAFLKAKPRVDASRCEGCCFCAGVCPMGAIPRDEPMTTTGVCIKCQACVQRCPARARYFDDPAFLSHVAMLEQNCKSPVRSVFWL